MSYLGRVGAAVRRDRHVRRSLAVLAVIAAVHLIARLVQLWLQWSTVVQTWFSEQYRFLYRHPYLEIADFVFRPLILWFSIAMLLVLVSPWLPRRDHGTERM